MILVDVLWNIPSCSMKHTFMFYETYLCRLWSLSKDSVYLLPLALVFQEHQAGEQVPLSIIIPEQSPLHIRGWTSVKQNVQPPTPVWRCLKIQKSFHQPLPGDSPHVPRAPHKLSHALARAKMPGNPSVRGVKGVKQPPGPQAWHPSWPLQQPAPVEWHHWRHVMQQLVPYGPMGKAHSKAQLRRGQNLTLACFSKESPMSCSM